MESSELIGLVSAGRNAALVAAIGGDASWNVSADWGFGGDWKAERVPVGIKFRRFTNGLVTEEILIVRGAGRDRLTHEKLLALSRVPAQLLFVETRPTPRHRLAPPFPYRGVGRDS